MTRAYSGYLQSQLAGTKTKGVMGFKDVVNNISGKEEVSPFSTKDMTLEEYKQYIYQKISMIPMHPSQAMRSVSIHISDEGFEAMQKDPEYEKWVMDTLKYDFGYYDPWSSVSGGSFTIHRFGATREEYRGDSWYTGFQGGRGRALYEKEAEESFWEKRRKRHKLYIQQQQEMANEKKILQRVCQEAAVRRGDYEHMFDAQGATPVLSMAKILLTAAKKVK